MAADGGGFGVYARWHQCAPHLVHLNWHLQHTSVATCQVALCISTIGQVRACPGPILYTLKIAPSYVGIWTRIKYMVS